MATWRTGQRNTKTGSLRHGYQLVPQGDVQDLGHVAAQVITKRSIRQATKEKALEQKLVVR